MRDIGGKPFDRIHAIPKRFGHIAKRGRQIADFITAIRQIGNGKLAVFAAPDPFGRTCQPVERPCDHPGKIDRQQHRDAKGKDKDFQDIKPHRMQGVFNRFAAFGHHHRCQNLLESCNRDRHRQDPASFAIDTNHPARIARQGCAHFRVIGRAGNRRIDIKWQGLFALKQCQDAIGQFAHDVGKGIFFAGWWKLFGLNGARTK